MVIIKAGAFYMTNDLLNTLLQEYETKKRKAFNDLEARKQALYLSCPRLQEIEDELNHSSIQTVKSILYSNNNEKETYLENLNKKLEELRKERLQILSTLGKDESYLEPIYECNICKDTGYIVSNHATTMCNCLKQKIFDISYNQGNLNKLDSENFSTFDFSKYSDEPDVEKYKINVSPRQNIKNILTIVKQFVDNFDSPKQNNLLFTGNTGLGKTFLSNCIANEMLKRNKTVLYQTSPIMLDTIIDYRFNKNDGTIYNNLLTVDLLIIDDLGTETINSMKFTELFNVINSRLLNLKTKTIISTNLSLKELFSYYDERIVSRFIGNYSICKFFGDDIRLKK